ncbi:MAG: hypothetical protein R3F22_01770 [Lysobacteraceae bacterium]
MNAPEVNAPDVNPAPVSADAVRSRRQLYLIALAFAAPLLIAMLLRGLGWQPIASRNHGELVQPPFDISAIPMNLQDGGAYQWEPLEARFHLLVRQDGDCDADCAQLADMLHRVWAAQGRQAERVDVLWLGDAPPEPTRFRHWIGLQPSAELEAALAEHGVADARLLMVDPNGFVMMRYEDGFDPSGLRLDIKRLVK